MWDAKGDLGDDGVDGMKNGEDGKGWDVTVKGMTGER